MSLEGLSINFATVRQGGNFGAIVDACLAHGITAISPWREQVHGVGLAEAARIVEQNGLRLSGHCRGGFSPPSMPMAAAAPSRIINAPSMKPPP